MLYIYEANIKSEIKINIKIYQIFNKFVFQTRRIIIYSVFCSDVCWQTIQPTMIVSQYIIKIYCNQAQADIIFLSLFKKLERMYNRRNQQKRHETGNQRAYIQAVRQFLATFKTKQCEYQSQHDLNACSGYHSSDRRRNPYFRNSFAYFPDAKSLHDNQETEGDTEQMLCMNDTQLYYHPIVYKTQKCINYYNCPHGLLCSHCHYEDQKAFQYGQFFRFNIQTHKTKPCFKRQYHQRKTCIYYHNQIDRRRANLKQYCHEICQKTNCKDQKCSFSHNKIQQVYHPSRYKTKFCKIYTIKSFKCEYKQFCGFAHTQAEIKIQMIHLLERNQDFYMRKYKTIWCPDTLSHDRSNCVYAHNIQDFRRDPFSAPFYESDKCPNWNFDDELKSIEDSGCKAGMDCKYCHGWMEQRYHPQVFKKGKLPEIKDVTLILDKKLSNTQKQIPVKEKVPVVSGLSSVVEDKISEQIKAQQINIHNGAPFFKKQATSQSSRRSKALTTNIESDDSSHVDEQPKVTFVSQKIDSVRNRKKNMFLFSEDIIWGNQEDENNEFEKKLNEERARSENKFDECDTVYSHSLKQTVGNSFLLKKLKNNNINGPKIKNLNEKQIEDLKFLDNKEKQQLGQKVRLYQLRRERNPVMYSLQLAKFFVNKKKQYLLEKTKIKKIKEDQLLGMKRKNNLKLEFLNQEDSDQLLQLLDQYRKFCNEKEFHMINEEIIRFVGPKRTQNKDKTG